MTSLALVTALLGVALILLASVFVAAPLFGADAGAPAERAEVERERWERQKRQALAALKELELDHRMGKVSDDDLAGMRARFEAQALEAMAALEGKGNR